MTEDDSPEEGAEDEPVDVPRMVTLGELLEASHRRLVERIRERERKEQG